MRTVDTFSALIFLGLRVGYIDQVSSVAEVEEFLEDYCQIGLCVTLTETKYIYTGGKEKGVMIGLINYPRRPMTEAEIKETALDLAEQLKDRFFQFRVSVMFPDKTMMLE